MKYLILLGDGMADIPYLKLNHQTPLDVAHKPSVDRLASLSFCGMVQTIPEGMEPGSGPANMSVMGYEPQIYYSGRSPLEAISMGVPITERDTIFRCNLVTIDSNENLFGCGVMNDYSAGEISTQEAKILIKDVQEALCSSEVSLYPGRSYRHCLVWKNGPLSTRLTPPHDITGCDIKDYLPSGEGAQEILQWSEKAYSILKNHPVNAERIKKGKKPANSIWLWGQGTKPLLPKFSDIYIKKGAAISAVDLIFGIAKCSGLDTCEVEGATGTLDSNFKGKAQAAIKLFQEGYEYVYLHVEAADECGHQGDHIGKVMAIEKIDSDILSPLEQYFQSNKNSTGEDYKIMFLPDHPTPLDIKTHTSDPVPFMIYDSRKTNMTGISKYCEDQCKKTGHFFDSGPKLFRYFIDK